MGAGIREGLEPTSLPAREVFSILNYPNHKLEGQVGFEPTCSGLKARRFPFMPLTRGALGRNRTHDKTVMSGQFYH